MKISCGVTNLVTTVLIDALADRYDVRVLFTFYPTAIHYYYFFSFCEKIFFFLLGSYALGHTQGKGSLHKLVGAKRTHRERFECVKRIE